MSRIRLVSMLLLPIVCTVVQSAKQMFRDVKLVFKNKHFLSERFRDKELYKFAFFTLLYYTFMMTAP